MTMRRITGLLVCALLLQLCAAGADSAIEWNGHTYKLFSSEVTWEEAKQKCEEAGGYLAAITSREEQDFICKQIMNHRGEVFWIGLEDEETEAIWHWLSGEKFRFQNWGPNEPNNTNGAQDHACIHTVPHDWGHSNAGVGQWDDDFYGIRHGYICEWDTPIR